MTTTNNQPTAQEIAERLGVQELEALKMTQIVGLINSIQCNVNIILSLKHKGLLREHVLNHEQGLVLDYKLTPLGLAVLEARASALVAGKPATVTAKEFIEQGYAEKIKHGECKVTLGSGNNVIDSISIESGVVIIVFKAFNYMGEWVEERPLDAYFTVTWLTPPQPATAEAANETAEGSGADDDAIQARALDTVSTQWVQLHQLISEALGLEFLPNEDIERYEEAIIALRDQNVRLQSELIEMAYNAENNPNYDVVKALDGLIEDLPQLAKGEQS